MIHEELGVGGSEMGDWWGGERTKMERLEREMPWEGRAKGVWWWALKLSLGGDDWRHVEQTERNRRASIGEVRRVRISPRSSLGSSDHSAIGAQIVGVGKEGE